MNKSKNIGLIVLVVLAISGILFLTKNTFKSSAPTITEKPVDTSKSNECPAGQSKKAMGTMCMADPDTKPVQYSPADAKMIESMANAVTDDKTFVQGMIPHHQEAIDTSNLTLKTTTNPELKTFLQKVVVNQQKEVDTMKTYYKTTYGTDYVGEATKMMGDLSTLNGDERDKQYMQGMIIHHKSAVAMAKKMLSVSEVKQENYNLATSLIANQLDEIVFLESQLQTRFNIAPTSVNGMAM